MRRTDSLEKTLMLGKTEGRRRRAWQRMRWRDGITDTVDKSLSKLPEMVKDREAWSAATHRAARSWPRHSERVSKAPQGCGGISTSLPYVLVLAALEPTSICCGSRGLECVDSAASEPMPSLAVACGILAPQSGIKPKLPALEGGFLTTGPPGKPQDIMAAHSSTPAWKLTWAEERGRLQSMGSRTAGHD